MTSLQTKNSNGMKTQHLIIQSTVLLKVDGTEKIVCLHFCDLVSLMNLSFVLSSIRVRGTSAVLDFRWVFDNLNFRLCFDHLDFRWVFDNLDFRTGFDCGGTRAFLPFIDFRWLFDNLDF